MRRLIIRLLHRLKEWRPWVQARLPRVRETVHTYVVYLAVTALLLVLSFSLLTYHAWRDYRGGPWGTPETMGLKEQTNQAGKEAGLTKSVGQLPAVKEKQSQQSAVENSQVPETSKPASSDVHPETREVRQEKMVKPLAGTIVTAYGWQEDAVYKGWRFFSGVDVRATRGSEVHAAKSGKVMEISRNERGTSVKIAHADGMVTIYGQLTESYLSAGQIVGQGQALGWLDKAGEAALHFEIWQDNHSIDPSELFRD